MINGKEWLRNSISVARAQGRGKHLFAAQASSIYAPIPGMRTKAGFWLAPRENAARVLITVQIMGASNNILG